MLQLIYTCSKTKSTRAIFLIPFLFLTGLNHSSSLEIQHEEIDLKMSVSLEKYKILLLYCVLLSGARGYIKNLDSILKFDHHKIGMTTVILIVRLLFVIFLAPLISINQPQSSIMLGQQAFLLLGE